MSTKIWEAYKIPIDKLNDFIDIVREVKMKEIVSLAKSLFDCVKEEAIDKRLERDKSYRYYSDEEWAEHLKDISSRIYARFELFWELIEAGANSRERTPLDITCGFNMWCYDGNFYIIPFGEHGSFRGVKFPEWVTEYHYQNQTDKPSRISNKEWNNRRKTWDKVCLGDPPNDWNSRRIYYSLFNPKFDKAFISWELEYKPIIELKRKEHDEKK
jgi:hypothetical protein